jgi:hypothetical protein
MPRASSKALGLHVGEFISCKQLIASNAQKKSKEQLLLCAAPFDLVPIGVPLSVVSYSVLLD